MGTVTRWYARGMRSPARWLLLCGHALCALGLWLAATGWQWGGEPVEQASRTQYIMPEWIGREGWHDSLLAQNKRFTNIKLSPLGSLFTDAGTVERDQVEAEWYGTWSDWLAVRRELYRRAPQVLVEREELVPAAQGLRVSIALRWYRVSE